jgi:hypothetical protein
MKDQETKILMGLRTDVDIDSGSSFTQNTATMNASTIGWAANVSSS